MSKNSVIQRIEAQEWMAEQKAKIKGNRSEWKTMAHLGNEINKASGLHMARQAYDSIARKSNLPRLSTAKAILGYRDALQAKVQSPDIDKGVVIMILQQIDARLKELVRLSTPTHHTPA